MKVETSQTVTTRYEVKLSAEELKRAISDAVCALSNGQITSCGGIAFELLTSIHDTTVELGDIKYVTAYQTLETKDYVI